MNTVQEEILTRIGRSDLDMKLLEFLREHHVGEDFIEPEPDWKRERTFPDERPEDGARIWFFRDMVRREVGTYFDGDGRGVFLSASGVAYTGLIRPWGYLEEIPHWVSIERDGNPKTSGNYHIREMSRKVMVDSWADCWGMTAQSLVTHYWSEPIPDPPPFGEKTQ